MPHGGTVIVTDEYVRDQCRAVSGIRLSKLEMRIWAWFGGAIGLLSKGIRNDAMRKYYHGLAIGRMNAANSLTLGFITGERLWFEFDFTNDDCPQIIPMWDRKRIIYTQIGAQGTALVFVITGLQEAA